jgi:hypothetical protein
MGAYGEYSIEPERIGWEPDMLAHPQREKIPRRPPQKSFFCLTGMQIVS